MLVYSPVGLSQRLVGDGREDFREIRCRMQGTGGDLVARHAADIDARAAEELTGVFEQRHAAIFPRRFAQREERGRISVQQGVRYGIATGDAFIATAERNADPRRNPRLLGIGGDLVEDLAARCIERHATLDEIVGETTLKVQATCKIVDGSDTFAFGIARAGRNRLCIDLAACSIRDPVLQARPGGYAFRPSVTASSMAAFS